MHYFYIIKQTKYITINTIKQISLDLKRGLGKAMLCLLLTFFFIKKLIKIKNLRTQANKLIKISF